jgi:eukaryotic-like serine/threonine-protein kinase
MGRNKNDGGDEYESPAHQVTVAPFYMDLYEVTNEQYLKFVRATKHPIPKTWTTQLYPIGQAHKPVTGVSWDDANAYAKWVGRRLPNEEEWEFAARGTDGRRYPWGNQWEPRLANANGTSRAKADVGTYKGVSPFGVYDMVGNAWEWTASKLSPYPGGTLPKEAQGELTVIRGGSYAENSDQATTTYRGFVLTRGGNYDKTGFRCVIDAAPQSQPK